MSREHNVSTELATILVTQGTFMAGQTDDAVTILAGGGIGDAVLRWFRAGMASYDQQWHR